MNTTTATPATELPYPVRLTIDYPERPLDRVSTGFRLVLALPIMVLLYLLSWGSSSGMLTAPVALMLLFRRKYPHWWFEWQLQLSRFETRACAYVFLLGDRYPSTDDEQGVHLEIDEPDAATLNRWLPLVKWLLALPHIVVLAFLFVGVLGATIAAWFAILFTGRYPRRLFGYVEGVLRWASRVQGYAFTLVTDRYPPFRLRA